MSVDWETFSRQTHESFLANGYDKWCVQSSGAQDVAESDICEYIAELDRAEDEKPMQVYLQKHPSLIVGEWGAECRWVIPQKSLGGKYVPDFLVARLDSMGVNWTLVELESPRASLFTKDGRNARQLANGIKQINDWRRWLANNLSTARSPRSHDGLGLVGIGARARGIVIIGRANTRSDDDRERIQQIADLQRIDTHSYDWFAREARQRMEFRASYGDHSCEECPEAASR
jgi:hypothetical protein